jgi:hypothetical protein
MSNYTEAERTAIMREARRNIAARESVEDEMVIRKVTRPDDDDGDVLLKRLRDIERNREPEPPPPQELTDAEQARQQQASSADPNDPQGWNSWLRQALDEEREHVIELIGAALAGERRRYGRELQVATEKFEQALAEARDRHMGEARQLWTEVSKLQILCSELRATLRAGRSSDTPLDLTQPTRRELN